jgi:hypothetical protein
MSVGCTSPDDCATEAFSSRASGHDLLARSATCVVQAQLLRAMMAGVDWRPEERSLAGKTYATHRSKAKGWSKGWRTIASSVNRREQASKSLWLRFVEHRKHS